MRIHGIEHRSHERAPSEAPLWCLLLSATTNVQVDLRNSSFGRLQQRNTSERQHMYAQVLAHWVGAYPEVPVVLAENSNDSLAWSWTDATKGARLERLRELRRLRVERGPSRRRRRRCDER